MGDPVLRADPCFVRKIQDLCGMAGFCRADYISMLRSCMTAIFAKLRIIFI